MGKFKKNSKMKKKEPNVLKLTLKIQGANVKLALKIKRKSINNMIYP